MRNSRSVLAGLVLSAAIVATSSAQSPANTKSPSPVKPGMEGIDKRVVVALEELYAGNSPAVELHFAPAFIDHDPDPRTAGGIEGLKQSIAMLKMSIPDLKFSVEELVNLDGRVLVRGTVSGNATGIAPVPGGVPQTKLKVIEIYKVDGNMITERWGIRESLAMGGSPDPNLSTLHMAPVPPSSSSLLQSSSPASLTLPPPATPAVSSEGTAAQSGKTPSKAKKSSTKKQPKKPAKEEEKKKLPPGN